MNNSNQLMEAAPLEQFETETTTFTQTLDAGATPAAIQNSTETKNTNEESAASSVSDADIAEVQRLFQMITQGTRTTLEQALELGQKLATIKEVVLKQKKEKWGDCVRNRLQLQERTVQRYLKLAKYREEITKNDTVTDITSAYRLVGTLAKEAKAHSETKSNAHAEVETEVEREITFTGSAKVIDSLLRKAKKLGLTIDPDIESEETSVAPVVVSTPLPVEVPRETMNKKPVLWRENAQTVLNLNCLAFQEKQLCDGIVLNLGEACAYSCTYCYVPSLMGRFNSKIRRDNKHADVVIRHPQALELLKQQLLDKHGRPRFMNDSEKIVYSSSTVDCAANMVLVKETAAACSLIFELTPWKVRLLTKSNLLPQLVELIPAQWHHRLILGISIGTLDDSLAKTIEIGTPLVSKRLASLYELQDAGLATFGMCCPSLPQADYGKFAQEMAQALRIEKCQHVWAEVINNRGGCFKGTIEALNAGQFQEEANRLRIVSKNKNAWEEYARATFEAHAGVIPAEKLRFLQYITEEPCLPYWRAQESRGAVLLGKLAQNVTTSTEVI